MNIETYNYLKDNFEYRGTGFVFINNNFGVGEQTLEEDTAESYQYLAERRRIGVGNDELSIQQDQEQIPFIRNNHLISDKKEMALSSAQ